MTQYTCNICKAEYSHDKAYRHFLDCSWNQVKAKRDKQYTEVTIDYNQFNAGYGLHYDRTGPISTAAERS